MPVTVSRANRALIVPSVPGVLSMFPSAPSLPGGNSLVPHGLRETLMLRHLGFKCPNPMDFYYDWNGGTPFAVQRATCRMLVENPRAYVLNHMGTGKSRAALWAWDYLRKCRLAGKLLVVAPLSTLNFVWAREIFTTLPGCWVEVLHGSKQARLDKLERDADAYVINHDGLKVIESELRARADIDTLVLDELAVYRNNSDRSKRMRKFADRFAIVWGMTGSPMPNEPTDVWSQCMIITPNRVPRYKNHARDALMTHVSNYVWKPKPDAVQRAYEWMQPSCRYSLEDVVELPPLIKRTIDVPLSAEQSITYKRVATAMQAMVKDKTITAVNAGAAMNKLLQIAGGWVYTKNPEFVRLDPTPRILAMADLIQSADDKVIVAVPYRHMIEGVSKIMSMKGVDIDHCVVHGDTKDRDQMFNMFQNTDKFKVMLAHPGCVHHGLTLTAASTIIWYLPITSLDVYDQFNARITRIGQKNKQQLLHLQAAPIEKRIYKMLLEHQKMQNLFLELVEEATEGAV
jgi:SNF2 family DNA or RNA helicase